MDLLKQSALSIYKIKQTPISSYVKQETSKSLERFIW